MPCGADTLAGGLMETLVGDEDFELPPVDLTGADYQFPSFDSAEYQALPPITTDMLTTRELDGSGVFDALMDTVGKHIKREMDKGRIVAADYAKIYVSMVDSVLGQSVQFLLQRDVQRYAVMAALSQAKAAEASIVRSRVELEVVKASLRAQQLTAKNTAATYANTKMNLALLDAQYCTAKYTLETLLPLQKASLEEEVDAKRAQTKDTLTSGTPVTGLLKRQVSLLEEQRNSYRKDAATKLARLYVDTWITQKGIDEGLLAPTQFQNPSVDSVMASVRNISEV